MERPRDDIADSSDFAAGYTNESGQFSPQLDDTFDFSKSYGNPEFSESLQPAASKI
jgi:hypothetical protein